jgi:hypothetical protein
MNGLGLPKRFGMAQAISDFTTTKCVRIGTLSGTGSDYNIPCKRYRVLVDEVGAAVTGGESKLFKECPRVEGWGGWTGEV